MPVLPCQATTHSVRTDAVCRYDLAHAVNDIPSLNISFGLPYPYLDPDCWRDGACYPDFDAAGTGRARPGNEFALVVEPEIGLSMIYAKNAVLDMLDIGRVSCAVNACPPTCRPARPPAHLLSRLDSTVLPRSAARTDQPCKALSQSAVEAASVGNVSEALSGLAGLLTSDVNLTSLLVDDMAAYLAGGGGTFGRRRLLLQGLPNPVLGADHEMNDKVGARLWLVATHHR